MSFGKTCLSIVVIALLCWSLSGQTNETLAKYKNPKLSIDERVNDLVSRMTLEEKVSQMMHAAPAIPRLDVPAYNWWNESLHGVARAGTATVFPQSIGLAATWDTDLMFRVADAISTEARAKNNEFIRHNQRGQYQGLTMFSPNINIFRDPRWGRGQETYGEDPYLTARLGVQFIKGLQGNDPKYFKVIATAKHYAVHSGPEPERHRFNAVIDERDLYETYLPAFEASIKEAGAYSVMCAYNRYQGEPCCANEQLLKKILRTDWEFPGYVVTDCGAVDDIYVGHKTVATAPEASALAHNAGVDLECGRGAQALIEAVKQGLVPESQIDLSLKRLFTARFKLGMFDPPDMVPYTKIPIEANDSAAHRELSLQAARESIVLLKNEGGLLPLKKDLRKIAVIGPTANDEMVLLGNYNGTPSKSVTVLKGIENKVSRQTEVKVEQGCDLVGAGPSIKVIPSQVLSNDGKPGLKADYFGNRELNGKPILTRTDLLVDSNWDKGDKVPGLGTEDFSIRWTGKLTPILSGNHVLAVTGDDGYRLWLDGKLVIDNWTTHAPETTRTAVNLVARQPYEIKLEYFQGGGGAEVSLQWAQPDDNSFNRAVAAASGADVIVFVGGITPRVEGEEMKVPLPGFNGGDRTDINLPKIQEELLKALQATGKPVVLVLTGGGALAVNWANQNIPAIVQAWYPGEEGGTALAEILFGDYNPSGRLPVTVYKSVDQLPPFESYNMAGRTYRYFKGEPLYPFGYGLSYTRFSYSKLEIPKQVRTGEDVNVRVKVTNVGPVAGDEVAQLYVKNLTARVPVPIQSLQGFKRIHLDPGQSAVVSFTLTPKQLSLIDNKNKRVEEAGEYQISTGGESPGTRTMTAAAIGKFKVTGNTLSIKQ